MILNENLFEDKDYGTTNSTIPERVDNLLANLFKELGVDPKEAEQNRGYTVILQYITFIASQVLGESVETSADMTKLIELLNESVYEDDAYTYEESEKALKDYTKNWTKDSGTSRTYYKKEKDNGIEILKKHYKVVEVSDGRGSEDEEMSWVISYSDPIKD